MTTAGQRRLRRRLFHLFHLEHGALLWVPAILAAAVFFLWAMQVVALRGAPRPHAGELRLLVGPVTGLEDEPATVEGFREALRAHLQQRRTLLLHEPDSASMHAVLGAVPPEDPRAGLHSAQALAAAFYLTGQMSRLASGDLQARIEIWDTATELRLESVTAHAKDSRNTAKLLADSLGVVLSMPPIQRSAHR